MALTGTEIFRRAVMIMDEQSDTGLSEWADTEEYKNRAVPILNVLINECYPYSDTFTAEKGTRAVAAPIKKLEDSPDLDDYLCGTVLPYGLAAHLCMDDDPRVSEFSRERYETLLAGSTRTLPAQWESIEDFYGIEEHNSFARW